MTNKTNPHILFISHRVPYPPNKGEKIRTFHQVRHLTQIGYKVTVCSPVFEQQDIENMLKLRDELSINVAYEYSTYKWIRLALGILLNKPLSVANFYSRKLQSTIDNIVKTKNITTIICTSSSTSDYVLNMNFSDLQSRPKLIMDLMDVDSLKWKSYSKNRKYPMNIIYAREYNKLAIYEMTIAEEFDFITLISMAELDIYTSSLPSNTFLNSDKIKAIGNGVSTDVFFPVDSPASYGHDIEPSLLFVGVMNYYPNVEAVIWFIQNIWPDLVKLHPNVKLKIAGMQPTKEIRKLNNIHNISVTGYVEDITTVFHEASVFIAPFITARGVQNKILQAFASGIPVVTSEIGAEGIDCKHRENVLIAKNNADYLSSISLLLNDKDIYTSIRNNALELIHSQYNWKHINAEWENIVGN